jgi:hypothetical protein
MERSDASHVAPRNPLTGVTPNAIWLDKSMNFDRIIDCVPKRACGDPSRTCWWPGRYCPKDP